MSRFEDYLKNADLIFEDYEKWFQNLKAGDSVHRNYYHPNDLAKIKKVVESPTGNGIKFETLFSSGASEFYQLNSTAKTLFLKYSEDKTEIINNPENFPILSDDPENFPILSEVELIKFRHSSKSTASEILSVPSLSYISEDKIYDMLSFKPSEEKQEEEMSGRHPKPPLPEKNNKEEVQIRKPAPIYTMPLVEETEEEQMSDQTALKKEEIPNKEYPIIEIKDMKAGDLIQDPFGNLRVYYSQDFYDENGLSLHINKELKYRLVQKRKYIRPLDAFFYVDNSLKSSLESGSQWFSTCAKLGREPEIVKRHLFAPSCQYIEAIFSTRSDALDYIASRQEPQLHVLVVNSDCKYVVTKYFTNTGVEIELQKNTNKLEAELAKEKNEKEQLLLEFKRLQETNLLNETSKNELSAQASSREQLIRLLKGDLAARDQEIRLLKKYRDELTAEHKSEIESVRQSLKATREQYEDNLKTKDEAFSTLQLQATYIENHRDKLLEDLEESRKKFETCEDHRRFLLKKVDEELQKVAFSNQQLQRVLAEKDELRHKLNNSLEQAKSLVGATLEVSKLKDRVADLMEKNEELKGSLQILETKRVQLQCQLEREEGVSTKWHQEAVACRQKLEKLSALVNLHA